jgi:Na+-driven multidrug efflux pump
VGVAAGANDWRRAVRAAWVGSLVAGLGIGLFGWIVAIVPEGWARLFTNDSQVIAATVAYITHVAPFYCLFGIGMTLSFASQGAGRMTAPFFAGIARLCIATVGGWFMIESLDWGLHGVFTAIAIGMVAFGSLIAGPLLFHPWRARA